MVKNLRCPYFNDVRLSYNNNIVATAIKPVVRIKIIVPIAPGIFLILKLCIV